MHPKISVVIPVYNEEFTVGECIQNIVMHLSQGSDPFEIVAVNDASRDDTLKVLQSLVSVYPKYLRVASHARNRGNGAALRTGIRLARGDIVVCMDADGQHQASEIDKLVNQIPPYDMVVGTRKKSYEGKWYRNFANRFYNWFASWLTEFPIEDLTSGFRAMRRSVITHYLSFFPSGFSAPTTSTMLLLKAGYNLKYIPVDVLPRTKGKSSIRLIKDGSKFLIIILRMILLYDPLRVFLPVTIVLAVLGILSWIIGILVAARLVVPGSTVVLFIAATLSLLLGLVSTQISNASIVYYGDEFLEVYEGEEKQTDA